MITQHTDSAVKSTLGLLADNHLRSLLTERVEQLTNAWKATNLSDLTHFPTIQAGDTAADAENDLGWSLLVNPVDGVRFGDTAFTSS